MTEKRERSCACGRSRAPEDRTPTRLHRRPAPGNLDAWLLTRDLGGGRTEVTTVSRWESLDAIAGFAGADLEQAVFYPEDDRYLVERDTRVRHYAQRN